MIYRCFSIPFKIHSDSTEPAKSWNIVDDLKAVEIIALAYPIMHTRMSDIIA
jgi:hypothetical protein